MKKIICFLIVLTMIAVIGSSQTTYFQDISYIQVDGIFKYAAYGDVAGMEKLVAKDKVSVNSLNPADNKTPLHYAALMGQEDVVDFLLKNGAEVDKLDNSQMAPIHYAALSGRIGIVKKLAENGAQLNPEKGFSPIIQAISGGHKDILEFMVDKGAKLDCKTQSGDSLFILASGSEHPEIFEYLKSKGLKPTIFDAAGTGNVDMLKEMIEKDSSLLEAKDAAGNTPLSVAAMMKKIDASKYLIEKGAKIDEVNNWKTPILHRAVQSGDPEIVKLLLQKGAKIEITDSKGDTPLARAVSMRNLPVIKALLEKGANPDAEIAGGDTPIILAEKAGDPSIMEALQNASKPDGKLKISASGIDKGSEVPGFEAETIDGKKIKLEEYKGKAVLLLFWATYFEKSQELIPDIKAAYEKYNKDGLEVIGISIDFEQDDIKAYLKDNNLPWIQICREYKDNKQLAKSIKVEKIPAYILLDKDQKVFSANITKENLEETIKGALK